MYRSSSKPPPGWHYCDGSPINSSEYPELAEILDGTNLPDLRNLTIVGAGNNYVLGTTTGSESVTLTMAQMPSHQHYGWGEMANQGEGCGFGASQQNSYDGADGIDHNNYLYGTTWAGGNAEPDIKVKYTDAGGKEQSSDTWSSPSDNDSFSVIQPSIALNYFIFLGTKVNPKLPPSAAENN